jgi:hypothetical protein
LERLAVLAKHIREHRPAAGHVCLAGRTSNRTKCSRAAIWNSTLRWRRSLRLSRGRIVEANGGRGKPGQTQAGLTLLAERYVMVAESSGAIRQGRATPHPLAARQHKQSLHNRRTSSPTPRTE